MKKIIAIILRPILLAQIIILLGVCPITLVYAQSGDTVHSRMQTLTLPDSTKMFYEIGWITISHGTYKYLSFSDTSGLTPNNYFKTSSFVTSGHDTLGFDRFAGFDNANYVRSFTAAATDPALDSFFHAVDTHYKGLEITPSNTSFDSNSTVRFLLQLCTSAFRSSSDSVIYDIDTLECFRDLGGRMRFENFPCPFNIRDSIPLQGLTIGHAYYFRIKRVDNIPITSHYIGYDYIECVQQHSGGGEGVTYFITTYQVGYPLPPPSAEPALTRYHKLSDSAIVVLNPNPTTGFLSMSIESPTLSPGTSIAVLDETGRRVYYQSADLKKGSSKWSLNVSRLTSGSYVLLVQNAKWKKTTNFIIAK
jgi:hypothetical protein